MLAPGFEEVDVSTVTRCLRRTGFLVAVVGLTAGLIRGAYGLSLAPDQSLGEVEIETPQAIVLPGGSQASRQLRSDPRVHLLLRRVAGQGGYVVALEGAHTVLRSASLLQAGVLHCAGSQSAFGSTTDTDKCSAGTLPGGSPQQPLGQIVVDKQVILCQGPNSAQEAALTLASLLGDVQVRARREGRTGHSS